MRITPNLRRRRLGRLLAATVGVVAVGLFASSTAAAATSRQYSSTARSGVSDAVAHSGIDGIAWYTDAALGRVVVTADGSVSGAEIATLRHAAGANAGALRIDRARGEFSPFVKDA